MTRKVKKKRKINKLNLWALIVSVIAGLGLIMLVVGIIMIASLLSNKPTLNINDFDQAESSIIYDVAGDEIASLGTVIRQNVEYEEIPNCVVDAFVAIEDSRFFQHNGFDIPRFTKAFLENIRTMSFGQGGSTFTMQLVKNTYFVDDEAGQEAARSGARGVRRKVQEIALALELEGYRSKQDIFESYVNKLNFGGSNNIRGIQKAAQYYFGKDISQLNLVEGALLAGVINAPNFYNPFYNLQEAQNRTTEVLYQMKNHGYISQAEYDLAKSIRIEDLLNDPYSNRTEGEGIPYQAYIDTVVAEVINLTGLDPYSTTMHIYTYMNKGIQQQMDDIQAGNFEDDYLFYPDEYFECASVCIKNSTGEVVGVLGGRNYADGGQLLLNHATDQYKQPGSSIKPILDYALAFENLGWATDHVLTDRPMWMDSSATNLVYNDSGTYVGDVTLRTALGQSINTCAIQALQSVLNAKKYEYVVNYLQSFGYDFSLDDFNIQYAVGGSTCEVTPFQHAAAYAGLMNYGLYNVPHTVERIEFTNGKSPISPVYESQQILSEAASFMTAELMYSNVESFGGSYSFVKTDKYPVYGKTGTTDYGLSALDFNIPSGAIKDGWLVAATSEYTTATWVGYEKAVIGQQSYITNDYYYNQRPQGKIAHLILEAAYEYGGATPTRLERPSDVVSISHILGTFPYAQFDSETMDPALLTTGLIKKDSAKLVALATPDMKEMPAGFDASINAEDSRISLTWPTYPDQDKLVEASDTKDISLKNASGDVIVPATGACLFDYTKLYGPIKYMADIKYGDKVEHVAVSEDKTSLQLDINPGENITVEGYYGYEKGDTTSNKETKNLSVQLKITIPSSSSSISDVEAWADKYNFINFETAQVDNIDNNNPFTVRDNNNNTYTYGQTIDINDSNLRLTVTYYVEKDLKLTYTTTNPDKDTKKLNIHVTYDGDESDLSWDYGSYDNLSINQNNKKQLSLEARDGIKDGSFRVRVTAKDKTLTIMVNISGGELSEG